MANDPSTTPGKPAEMPKPQRIPLSKIHDLPGTIIPKPPDRTYGGLVSSIQAVGVTEAVILRQREDGEYQLLAGYRRRRASELAKQQDIPAYVYEMTMQEALAYHQRQKSQPDAPVPGKLLSPPIPAESTVLKQGETKAADRKKPETLTPTASTTPKQAEVKAADGKKLETPAPTASTTPKQAEAKATDGKKLEALAPAASTVPKQADTRAPEGRKTEAPASATATTPKQEETKTTPDSKKADLPASSGPAATGPTGTAITQIFDARLTPPDENALKALPIPKEGDSYFISLHPGYLKKSKFNTFSVDRDSDNFKELYKAIELSGIKDPVLARPMADGGLEILSGQRRHLIGTELNYPIPTIIQQIDDDDAKIMVADSNLHRDKISTYDLSRALRMKADGMKRKAGRRRKNDPSIPLLNTNEALAKEMGMPVSKLDRIIRLSEATKEVCGRYDEGRLELSIAHSISFLKPKNQDMVMHLCDLGYKVSTVRVERMKKVEKAGKLTEQMMRNILDDKDIAPKVPVVKSGNATISTPVTPPAPVSNQPPAATTPASNTIPFPSAETTPTDNNTLRPDGETNPTAGENDIFKGAQDRPENVKVILTGDRLRRYYPDVTMTPREIEEDIYDKLDRCKKMDERQAAKGDIFKKPKGPER